MSSSEAERFIHMVGSEVWKMTYRRGLSDNETHAFIVNEAPRVGAARLLRNGAIQVDSEAIANTAAAAKWVHGGCRILCTDQKYAAAMCLTKLGEEAAGELRVPWPTFLVRLPPDLLVGEDKTAYECVLLSMFENCTYIDREGQAATYPVSATYSVMSGGLESPKPSLWNVASGWSLADLLFRSHDEKVDDVAEEDIIQIGPQHSDLMKQSPSDRRIHLYMRRLVVGLLFTMQHTNNWKHDTGYFAKASDGLGRAGPPRHRTIVIGAPIGINCVRAVQADASCGEGVPPSFQSLVRGHLKRQVVGSGRTGRKVIWIEPYWRGPEDAPILARPYKVS